MYVKVGRFETNMEITPREKGEEIVWAETWQTGKYREIESRIGPVRFTASLRMNSRDTPSEA